MAKYRKCDICGKFVRESEVVVVEYKSKKLFEDSFVRFMSEDLCKECRKELNGFLRELMNKKRSESEKMKDEKLEEAER